MSITWKEFKEHVDSVIDSYELNDSIEIVYIDFSKVNQISNLDYVCDGEGLKIVDAR